jgi:glycosyltransferase involved in cell wall biosynthesis
MVGTDLAAGRGRWPAEAFGGAVPASRFDHAVVSLGSSANHVGALGALDHDVHVWLHEPSLVGLHIGRGHLSGSPAWSERYLRAEVTRNEGSDVAAQLERTAATALMDPVAYRALGIRLIAEPVRRALSVIVSSEQAAAVVQQAAPAARVLVLPHPFPAASPDRTRAPRGRRIVVFGWLGANKQSTRVLDVLAALGPSVSVDFVGAEQHDAGGALRAEVERRALAGRVTFHGRLDGPALESVLSGARVGVQLRDGDGEMSGAIAGLTARGIPVVTTLGTTAVFGDGIARVLDEGSSTRAIADAVRPLVDDDGVWSAASMRASALARSWTFADAAESLLSWLDRCSALEAGSMVVVGPGAPPPQR